MTTEIERVKCRDYVYTKVSEGSVVGRLKVMRVVGKSTNGSNLWKCLCDCGNYVDVISSSLNSGLVQSCGCLYHEIKGKQRLLHGKKNTREYRAWTAMKQRCYYEKHEFYKDYGGRGIKVCERWVDSFEAFLDDMGECPRGYSLDRLRVNEDYSPENCRWTCPSEQAYNTRKKKNNSSGRSGVSFHSLTGKWQASIGVQNRQIYLGIFSTYEEACKAREDAEIEYFGFNKE